MADEPKIDHVLLSNVRLSFPHLWKAKAMENEDEEKAKFQATFLLEKKEDEEAIKMIKVVIFKLAIAEFGDKDKVKAMFTKKEIKVCLHEGSSKDYDGYNEGNMFLSTGSKIRPSVIDRDQTPLAEADGYPYAGCYVNAAVRLWAQNNQYGKRVNCELLGVQFVKDGEAFGKPPFKPEEVFPKLEERKAPGTASSDAKTTAADDEIPF